MPKKSYPGGFRLTLATARRLAVQEFGTAKGLEPDRATELDGFFKMEMGNLYIYIRPDLGMSGCIELAVGMSTTNGGCIGYFNREMLEPVSTPVRFCSFSPNRKCRKMAGKRVQPLNNYTCRFCPSSPRQADKSGLDGLQADK